MKTKRLLCLLFVVALAAPVLAQAPAGTYTTTIPSDMLQHFADQRTVWVTNVMAYTRQLFALLAVIEFAWSAASMAMDKSELQSWSAALLRKVMWMGAFYMLLLYGSTWLPAIIDSFIRIGQSASGLKSVDPSAVFMQGLSTAAALMDQGSLLAFFKDPATSFVLSISALLIFISFALITLNFAVAMVESYICLGAGFIFLGFGGSRWTMPYTERYIGMAVSIGVKLLCLYCIIGAGMGFGVQWATEAQQIGQSPRPVMVCLDILGGALLFFGFSWQVPKFFASVIGGSPAFGAGDVLGPAAGVAGAATMAAGAALGGAGLAVKGASALSALESKAISYASGGSRTGAAVSPPSSSASGASGSDSSASSNGAGGAVSPPSTASAGSAAPSSTGRNASPPGTGLQRTGKQLQTFNLGDGAPHHTPPTMPIHHEEE